ncbi:hypothetical protein GCM10010211_68770 [Streptomyces albospinus]|uniref:Uncharacterized protein n=1 Tax=Streptomyces albospinus TaxID=285515 RepID=A0ABQ2VM97_9ACTN|nr:hypothetical protein [Streptomyces albospinus]GGU92269.1 hypothetical protein GCM10010211_68770 [Streptomyces albospinus]
MTSLLALARTSWRTWHRPLMVCSGLMAGLVLVCGAGLAVDSRTLLGEPVWYKPLKFGFAFGLYAGTLAWLLAELHKGRRLARWIGTVFAVTSVAEVGAITVQAARGTISHFNADQTDPVTTALTPVLTFGVMVIVIAQLVIGVVVLIQRTGSAALNRAIRAGIGLTLAGMLIPVYWMVTEIHPRTVTDANGTRIPMYQGHGIGDPDGNGMPLTHWSVTGGDFRVPHFFALHGIQVLLALVVVLGALSADRAWLRSEQVQARLVGSAALGYCGLVAVVTWQAGRGQSLIHPDTETLAAFATVLLITTIAIARVVVTARRTGTKDAKPLPSAYR